MYSYVDVSCVYAISGPSCLQGQWRNNLFNGQGIMIHTSGMVWDGIWTNGRPLGESHKFWVRSPLMSTAELWSALSSMTQSQKLFLLLYLL